MKHFVTILGQQIEKGKSNPFLIQNGFEFMTVDVNAFVGCISDRWTAQEIFIPSNKKGNLKKYAGKNVIIIPTTISKMGGARINFYIKENKVKL